MSSVPIHSEAEWLAIREGNVGGSEIACLFYRWRHPDGTEAVHHIYEGPPAGSTILGCLSSFKTGYRLWQEKAGRLAPADLSDVERVQAGTFLEPALAEWAKQKFDWKIRKVRRYIQHATVKGWGASLDYEVVEAGMPPVEFKNVDGAYFRDQWVTEDDEIVMPPLPYLLQLQHQIGAVESDHGWIVACVSGNRLLRGRIARHEPTQERIASAVTAFWKGVASGVEPIWLADYENVADLYRFGTPQKEPTDLTGDAELPALCESYLARKRVLDDLTVEVDNLKGQIAARIGESSKALTMGYRLTWPVVNRAEKVIPERIQKASTYRGALSITSLVKEEA